MAVSINDEGAITGYYQNGALSAHGFVRSPEGTTTSSDPPFCDPSTTQITPTSINDEGVVTGSCIANVLTYQVGWVRLR
jgi:hypothetical protein